MKHQQQPILLKTAKSLKGRFQLYKQSPGRYTGSFTWLVEGLPEMPDTLELAHDWKAFKRRKAYHDHMKNKPLRAAKAAIDAATHKSRSAAWLAFDAIVKRYGLVILPGRVIFPRGDK